MNKESGIHLGMVPTYSLEGLTLNEYQLLKFLLKVESFSNGVQISKERFTLHSLSAKDVGNISRQLRRSNSEYAKPLYIKIRRMKIEYWIQSLGTTLDAAELDEVFSKIKSKVVK